MKHFSTPTQQSRYRDLLGLTDDEIDKIAIGIPVRVRLQATSGGHQPSSEQLYQDASKTLSGVHRAVRILDSKAPR